MFKNKGNTLPSTLTEYNPENTYQLNQHESTNLLQTNINEVQKALLKFSEVTV